VRGCRETGEGGQVRERRIGLMGKDCVLGGETESTREAKWQTPQADGSRAWY
jgi:hypothetical protein